MTYTDPAAFVRRRLDREDAKITRCTCGTWVCAGLVCGTCGEVGVIHKPLRPATALAPGPTELAGQLIALNAHRDHPTIKEVSA